MGGFEGVKNAAGAPARRAPAHGVMAHASPERAEADDAHALLVENLRVGSKDAGDPSLGALGAAFGPLDLTLPRAGVLAAEGSAKARRLFAAALSGDPRLRVLSGSIKMRSNAIDALSPADRALAGLFVSARPFPSLPGISTAALLRAATDAHRFRRGLDPAEPIPFSRDLRIRSRLLGLSPEEISLPLSSALPPPRRHLLELLQLEVLQPPVAVFDASEEEGRDPAFEGVLSRAVEEGRSQGRSWILLLEPGRAKAADLPSFRLPEPESVRA